MKYAEISSDRAAEHAEIKKNPSYDLRKKLVYRNQLDANLKKINITRSNIFCLCIRLMDNKPLT